MIIKKRSQHLSYQGESQEFLKQWKFYRTLKFEAGQLIILLDEQLNCTPHFQNPKH